MACQPTPPSVPPEKIAALNKPLKVLKNENPLVSLKAGYETFMNLTLVDFWAS